MSTPDTFKAATWNVFYGTDPAALRPTLARLRRDGVSVFLVQEASNPAVRTMLLEAGLKIAYAPRQYVVAYDPKVWTAVSAPVHERLGETAYYAKGGDNAQFSEAVSVILSDREGRTLKALSYHTPAHVQVAEPPKRRLIATRESMATLKRLADESETRAILFGGDDNVDEDKGFRTRWGFMRDRATGLRQVVAPKGTHGRTRRIDDFRVRGLVPGAGYVVQNASDHNAHVRAFRWS